MQFTALLQLRHSLLSFTALYFHSYGIREVISMY
jgi:hypothetical protein